MIGSWLFCHLIWNEFYFLWCWSRFKDQISYLEFKVDREYFKGPVALLCGNTTSLHTVSCLAHCKGSIIGHVLHWEKTGTERWSDQWVDLPLFSVGVKSLCFLEDSWFLSFGGWWWWVVCAGWTLPLYSLLFFPSLVCPLRSEETRLMSVTAPDKVPCKVIQGPQKKTGKM